MNTQQGGTKVLEKLWATSVILMYLGVGVILGVAIMLIKGNVDLAFGVGGILALIAAGIYAFCILRSRKKEGDKGMADLTYTYKDNPYPEGTKEHQIWYDAFVHGLNSGAEDNRLALNVAICLADKELSKQVSILIMQTVAKRAKVLEKQLATEKKQS